jgi:dienelactone hydrolase
VTSRSAICSSSSSSRRKATSDAARELVARVGPELGELFVYPGGQHLFLDRSLPTYDADAAALVMQRTLNFLSGL